MEQYFKDIADQVYPYEDSKIFKMTGVPQEFYFGALFWDDSYDPPRLRIWIDGMERERVCPRAFTRDELRAHFSLKRGKKGGASQEVRIIVEKNDKINQNKSP
jgi:hypothetical protein